MVVMPGVGDPSLLPVVHHQAGTVQVQGHLNASSLYNLTGGAANVSGQATTGVFRPDGGDVLGLGLVRSLGVYYWTYGAMYDSGVLEMYGSMVISAESQKVVAQRFVHSYSNVQWLDGPIVTSGPSLWHHHVGVFDIRSAQ